MLFGDRRRGIDSLVEQYYPSLYRYAYRLSGSSSDAEDLVQETFCKAQSQLDSLRDLERARPWLYAILRNLFLQRVRSDQSRKTVSLDTIGDFPQPAGDPLPEIDPAALQKVLNDMPEGFRTPIILYFFEEMSYREIADQMDLPIGTVMSRLARAKSHLRDRLISSNGLDLSR
jgi:RNA polymerase sigma-70 factor, ECF subfamily